MRKPVRRLLNLIHTNAQGWRCASATVEAALVDGLITEHDGGYQITAKGLAALGVVPDPKEWRRDVREIVKGSAVDAAAVMKVLVAPDSPQGNFGRKGFTWTTPGELVTLASSGDCFAGLDSRRCTSKAVVAEVEMTEAELVERLTASVRRMFGGGPMDDETTRHVEESVKEEFAWLKRQVSKCRVGDVVRFAVKPRA